MDPLVSLMMVEKVPDSTYEMVGGLDKQIKEIKEVCLLFIYLFIYYSIYMYFHSFFLCSQTHRDTNQECTTQLCCENSNCYHSVSVVRASVLIVIRRAQA